MSGAQMNKIEVKNVFKIFGPRADAALALIRQGRSKAKCWRRPAAWSASTTCR
ncbi:hypothetical protein P4056_21140 [Pseudomonas aeruginosa]|nr:hypothetical protein [Pseudomonas aeruginosa]